jgi:2-dehydro-3-deoxygluconokinase
MPFSPASLTPPAVGAEVVTFGEALAVLVADDGLPLATARRFRRTVAGAESNLAVALSRLGHRVAYATRTGADALGDGVLRTLRADGVDVTSTTDPLCGTGILVRDAFTGPGGAEVCYGRASSAGAGLSLADLPLHEWKTAAVAHVTGITAVLSESAHEAVVESVRRLKEAGVVICLDPNLRLRLTTPDLLREALAPVVPYVDIIVGSPDEVCIVGGSSNLADAARRLLELGTRLVVVKDGAAGSWATDGETTWQQPALPTVVVDPVGAGDAFVAGLLSGLLDQRPVELALRRAATLAAACVAALGDTEGLPNRRRLAQLTGSSEVSR